MIDAAELGDRVERALDIETHEQLCACQDFPGRCVTYGAMIPWTHSDVHRIVEVALEILNKKETTP